MNDLQIFSNPEFGQVRTVELDGRIDQLKSVINVQQDKQKPQYTLTYVDRYLGMGNVEDYLNPQTQPNAQEGFTVINDADDLPF